MQCECKCLDKDLLEKTKIPELLHQNNICKVHEQNEALPCVHREPLQVEATDLLQTLHPIPLLLLETHQSTRQ